MSISAEQKNTKAKNAASYVLSFSLFSVAAALVYFTWQISILSQQIPEVLLSIEKTSTKIEPVVMQVNEIKELIPPIIKEVSEIRQQIPLIIYEVQKTRQLIPDLLQSADRASGAVEQISKEIKATRPLVPDILKEVKTTREAIPPMLDRADKLVLNVRAAGKEASKGAVSGVLTGIITAPFDIVGSFGKKMFSFTEHEVKSLSDEDITLAKQSMLEVLSSDVVNFSSSWKTPQSETEGKVKLLEIDSMTDPLCKTINSIIWKSGKTITDKNIKACLDTDNTWQQQK